MKKQLKLAICLDGVIRNKVAAFDQMYRKKYIRNEGLVKMNDNFEAIEENEDEDEERRIENLIKDKIHLPISTPDLSNHYEFESEKEFSNFHNMEYVLQIYGVAMMFPKAMDTANRLQAIGEHTTNFTTSIIAEGFEQVITATYHFLTKNACRIKNISFLKIDSSVWDSYDIIITDLPELLDSKPSGKVSIKVNQSYNEGSSGDIIVESLKELNPSDLLALIPSNT